VLAGEFISAHVDMRTLTRVAGAAFIAIGIWTFVEA
jgi:putative Ca2+/H+ antiporter (TMEM165/GDT1 family)